MRSGAFGCCASRRCSGVATRKAPQQFDRMEECVDMNGQAIILFAHGARDAEWAAPFRAIQAQLQQAQPEMQVVLAFQDFMMPTLEAAAAQCAARAAQRIILVPLFMAQGGHLKHDLPLQVGKIRAQHPHIELRVMPAIGDAPEILRAITDWVLRGVF